MKARFHLIGENVNEVHEFYAGDPKVLEKWQAAFTTLLKDALNDGVDIEVIVVRCTKAEPDRETTVYIS